MVNILLVEDNYDYVNIISRMLSKRYKNKFKLYHTVSYKSALIILKTQKVKFDFVITDNTFQISNEILDNYDSGYILSFIIKNLFKDTKIILLTADDEALKNNDIADYKIDKLYLSGEKLFKILDKKMKPTSTQLGLRKKQIIEKIPSI